MPKTEKAERTRSRILEAALELLRERGYEGATMRMIAERAGSSLGSAYYYFPSKEHLVQAFYDRTHDEHLAICEPLLEGETSFERRLRLVLTTKLDTTAPYHRFAGVLFKTAGDPASPLNPFSDESAPVRSRATALYERVLAGSDLELRGPLAAELPRLLWLYSMGVQLFWIYDRSPNQRRSYRLVERTVLIVARLVRIANLAPIRPLARHAVQLLGELRELEAEPTREESSHVQAR